jgi:hypothetical protein
LAALAAREALEEAHLFVENTLPERIGLFAGVGLTAVDPEAGTQILRASLDDEGCFAPERFSKRGLDSVNPLWAFESLANMPACIISVLKTIKGESAIYTPYEDASALAVCEAALALEDGLVDLALVVASDCADEPSSLMEIAQLGYLFEGQIASAASAALVLTRISRSKWENETYVENNLAKKNDQFNFSNKNNINYSSNIILKNMTLTRHPNLSPDDPLAPFLGRTMAAAPIVLMALAASFSKLPKALETSQDSPPISAGIKPPRTSLVGSQGHKLSFEVSSS